MTNCEACEVRMQHDRGRGSIWHGELFVEVLHFRADGPSLLWQGSDSTHSSLTTRCLMERTAEKAADEESESAPRTSVSGATLGDSKWTRRHITVKPERKTRLLRANQLSFFFFFLHSNRGLQFSKVQKEHVSFSEEQPSDLGSETCSGISHRCCN